MLLLQWQWGGWGGGGALCCCSRARSFFELLLRGISDGCSRGTPRLTRWCFFFAVTVGVLNALFRCCRGAAFFCCHSGRPRFWCHEHAQPITRWWLRGASFHLLSPRARSLTHHSIGPWLLWLAVGARLFLLLQRAAVLFCSYCAALVAAICGDKRECPGFPAEGVHSITTPYPWSTTLNPLNRMRPSRGSSRSASPARLPLDSLILSWAAVVDVQRLRYLKVARGAQMSRVFTGTPTFCYDVAVAIEPGIYAAHYVRRRAANAKRRSTKPQPPSVAA